MRMDEVPVQAGVAHPSLAFIPTGKAGGAILVGSPVGSADGKSWTALAGDPTDLAGIARFDQKFADAGFATDDRISIVIFGIVSVIASAAIAAGARLTGAASGKVVSGADPGSAEIKNYLGIALSDAAADGDIIWMLVSPIRDTGIT